MTNPCILAVVAQKGGAGKTTLAINLAVAAALRGERPLIIDLDPQASATAWADTREADYPVVRISPAPRLARAIERARKERFTLVIIDTAPHAEGAALAAARAASLVIVPCRPALLDLHAMSGAADIAALAATPIVTVLNACPARGPLAHEARDLLHGTALDVLAQTLGQRAAFVHALNAGEGVMEHDPKGKAASEVAALDAALPACYPPPKLRLAASR